MHEAGTAIEQAVMCLEVWPMTLHKTQKDAGADVRSALQID